MKARFFALMIAMFVLANDANGNCPQETEDRLPATSEPLRRFDAARGVWETVIISNPLAPQYHLDSSSGTIQLPSSDGSRSESLSIDVSDATISTILRSEMAKQQMELLPEQVRQILDLRESARRQFLDAVSGLRTCDAPAFADAQRIVEQISTRLNRECREIILPHQMKAYEDWCQVQAFLGGVLQATLKGAGRQMLDESSRKLLDNRREEVRKMVFDELRALEKRAVGELLRDGDPEVRDRILGIYDRLPPNWTPNFNALLNEAPGAAMQPYVEPPGAGGGVGGSGRPANATGGKQDSKAK